MNEVSPLQFLQEIPSNQHNDIKEHTGLVVLNCPIQNRDLLSRLWTNSSYRVAADGGANRLFDLVPDDKLRKSYLPNEIHGDLDSLRSDVRQFYSDLDVPVTLDGDQYSTDMDKAIRRVLAALPTSTSSPPLPRNVVILGSLAGRVDQGISLLSALYRHQKSHGRDVRFVLVSEASISFVLERGKTFINVADSDGLIGENVGILPVYGPARITLTGFEWDVEDWPTELGGQVSSSNHIRADRLVVGTDYPVLFTIERNVVF